MDYFELVSEYAPTDDQPQAIEQLVKGFKEGYGEFKEFFRRMKLNTSCPNLRGVQKSRYLVLFGADLSIFCKQKMLIWIK